VHNLISIGLIPEPIEKFPEHSHSEWEIIYYTHGTGILKIGDKKFNFKPKDIICQPPGVPHSEYSGSGFQNIHFSVETFDGWGQTVPCFTDTVGNDYYNILIQLYREFHLKRKNWVNITGALLNVLYQYMLSWNIEKRKNPVVEELENILISNISNSNFQVDRELGRIPMSADHLRKLFKKETGKTPLQYLIDMRMNYAKQLLKSQGYNLTIKEIANMVGFSDPYYFSRTFKKVTSITPTEWSKK
jgi:hypothetical protein